MWSHSCSSRRICCQRIGPCLPGGMASPVWTCYTVSNTNIALIDKKHYPHPHFGILVEKIEDLPLELGDTVYHRDGTVGVYVKDPFGYYLEYIWYADEQKEVFLSD